MDYLEAIDYLYYKLPMYQREGSVAIKKLSLEPTLALCKLLDEPQHGFKSIHIAGTNGKGSCSHMIAGVLQAAGKKTGVYTSPHYKEFVERIKINGSFISKDKVTEFLENNMSKWEGRRTTFFELTVAMAFDYFRNEKVDYGVIETGLGGRLDSTNVISPEVAIITNISKDHTDILGNSIQEIAAEKAGIIKQNCPVIIGRRSKETDSIFKEKANEMEAPLYFAEDLIQMEFIRREKEHSLYQVKDLFTNEQYELKTDVIGAYQAENIRTSLAAIKILSLENNLNISIDHIQSGFKDLQKTVKLLGRWQILAEKPLVIADSAHNEDGMTNAIAQARLLDYKKLHIVLGFVKEKSLRSVLSLLPKEANYYFTNADVPRAMSSLDLKNKALEFELHGQHYHTVADALTAAKESAIRADLILVLGSIFVVAEVLE